MSHKLSIIILTKNLTHKLFMCLDSILKQRTVYYNILIGDTGSDILEKKKIQKYLELKDFTLTSRNGNHNYYKKDNIEICVVNKLEYHFSKNNNYLSQLPFCFDSNYFLFLNNDVYLHEDDLLIKMLKIYITNNAGTVGCKLLFPDSTIQHDGIVLCNDINNIAVTHESYCRPNDINYTVKTVLGNTGACLMVSKLNFNQYLFNESYNDCMQDVELNLRLVLAGYNNYIVSSSSIHDESSTRLLDPNYYSKINIDLLKIRPLLKEASSFKKYIFE